MDVEIQLFQYGLYLIGIIKDYSEVYRGQTPGIHSIAKKTTI